MLQAITHVALVLDDLAPVEAFYRELFGLQVYVRESKTAQGWKTLDAAIDHERAAALGLSVDLIILADGPVGLALERGAAGEKVFPDHVGLRLDAESLAALRADVHGRGLRVRTDEAELFVFVDPFGMTWEMQSTDVLRTSRAAGHGWIDAEGRLQS